MIQNGAHSTVIEIDFQLYYVQFLVDGTKLHSIEFYRPMMYNETTMKASLSGSSFVFTPDSSSNLRWMRVYEVGLEEHFREKYTRGLVLQRVGS